MNGVSVPIGTDVAGMNYYVLADGSAIGLVLKSAGIQAHIDINGKKDRIS